MVLPTIPSVCTSLYANPRQTLDWVFEAKPDQDPVKSCIHTDNPQMKNIAHFAIGEKTNKSIATCRQYNIDTCLVHLKLH